MAQHDKIWESYRVVLGKREDYGIAAPLSLLPYPKPEIKTAIQAALRERKDPQEREDLKRAFITLAEFIPDHFVERVNKNWQATADAECETNKEGEVTVDADAMAETIRIQKGIADEGARLSREIEDYIDDLSG
jgi:hypothetical protein